MPTYVYELCEGGCTICGGSFELNRPMNREALTQCPLCKKEVRKVISPIATPDHIQFASGLPKTRSGKIMRRLLKQIAGGGEIKGDTTTLEDFSVLAKLGGNDE